MKCPSCEHVNDGGNFCENCGARLVTGEVAAALPHASQPGVEGAAVATSTFTAVQQPNAHVENVKNVSKMYFSFFLEVLKKPVAATRNTNREELVNGLISIGIFALIIPLIIYLGLKEAGVDGEFMSMVIKPTFSYAIFILLIASYSFVAIKLGKVPVKYTDVIARFGSMLIPFLALFLLAFLMSLVDMGLYPVFLGIGFLGSVFIVPPLVISSFKKDEPSGLDALYGTLLTYVAIFITMGIMAAYLLSTLLELIEEKLTSLFFF